MEGRAETCVERYCALAWKNVSAFKSAETPCMDYHPFSSAVQETYLARIGRPDLLWTVNILARSVTKWNKACGGDFTVKSGSQRNKQPCLTAVLDH